MSSRDLASVQSYSQSIPVSHLSETSLCGGETHLVLIVLMQIHTALLRLPPSLRHRVVNIGLVNDLGYELRQVINPWRSRGRDLGTVNGVGGAVLDQKGQESEDGTDEKDDY